MQSVISEVLYGTQLENNPCPKIENAYFAIPGEFRKNINEEIEISELHLSKNMLFIGGTGSGKTNALNLIVREIRKKMDEEDVMIIFDTKGDFENNFFNPEKDIILGNSAKYRSRSEIWNIYSDVIVDGGSDATLSMNINEIARALFEPHVSESQPFFANAARGIFSAVMLTTLRDYFRGSRSEKDLNNRALLDYFNKAAMDNYNKIADSYPDFRKISLFLGDGSSTQALGVFAEIQVMMQDTFMGIFGQEGHFSIRNFVRQKGGKTLFLEYDMSVGETLAPLYSLLLDLAFKEALGRSSEKSNKGNVYVILDELKLLPYIQHLDDAVNFGREMGVKTLAGLQSMTQIHDMYGENKGDAILSGFCSVLGFRPNDAKTREYIQSRFGKNMVNEIFDTDQKAPSERRQGYVVEDWELSKLRIGEAVVGLEGLHEEPLPPFKFKFSKFEKGE